MITASLYAVICKGPLWVNLRHECFVPTGPLNYDLLPLQTHPWVAAAAITGHDGYDGVGLPESDP